MFVLIKNKKEIKTPLRYPGGKSKAIRYINPIIPKDFSEFREPFVGGGSVFIDAKQNINPQAVYKINDINFDLYCFWKFAKENCEELYNAVKNIKNAEKNGKDLFIKYREEKNYTDFERAVRFFVMNRITFSGTVDSGGYSQQAFENRFTFSSVEKIKEMSELLDGVEIYNKDYTDFLSNDGENVFIFLDPPYYSQSKSRLYGENGSLHTSFNHAKFAKNMKLCKHKWLITLDDCEENRKLFDFANIYEWELQYGMNNYKQEKAAVGKELFISNYDISEYDLSYC